MGGVAAANFAKLAATVSCQRLETPADRVDIIGKLTQGKDGDAQNSLMRSSLV